MCKSNYDDGCETCEMEIIQGLARKIWTLQPEFKLSVYYSLSRMYMLDKITLSETWCSIYLKGGSNDT